MSLPPVEIPLGAMRFNSDSQKLEYWNGEIWLQIHTFSPDLNGGGRAFVAGGTYPSNTNIITAVNTSSNGTSFDFGNLTQSVQVAGSGSSRTRAVRLGGHTGSVTDTIDYWTMSSTGDAIDFGNLFEKVRSNAGCSNQTRAVCFGGLDDPALHAEIQYITIASTGDSQDFGDLSDAGSHRTATSSSTRALVAGGEFPGISNRIRYITLASLGTNEYFGALSVDKSNMCSCSSSTRAVFMGGESPGFINVIEYVQIATRGKSQNFGDLSSRSKRAGNGGSDCVRGLYMGGSNNTPASGTGFNDIDSFMFATQGDTVDFGDLHTTAHSFPANGQTGTGHGGLG
tara:strand:- start:34 stop:1056 length:1023 start_codon:yes stop_codon:yes gene_type:complete